MKRTFPMILALLSVVCTYAYDIKEGEWTIHLDESSKRLTIQQGSTVLATEAYAEATVGDETLHSYEAREATVEQTDTTDTFGTGRAYTITYQMDNGVALIQTFSFYDGLPYLVTRLAVTRDGGEAQSNCLVPIASKTTVTPLPLTRKNRMLFVPWDNDGFIGYASRYLRGDELNSYAVTALYNYESREGIVAGAVDHDLWKSAIHVVASDYYNVDELALISGYTDEHSHDSILSEGIHMPHGTVIADTVRSSRFILGRFADWRVGMETFGEACAKVAPRREWAGGTPYGWSSWGVQQTSISYQGIIDCADFIRDNLVPHGFHDQQGRVVLSLDAWWNDNLSDAQVTQFVKYCQDNNMIPGLYYGSFCRFGDLESNVPGTNSKYRFKDIALKVHGRYKVIDGAYCLDPTHPGTKMFMLNDINKFKKWGIEYLKCDFMSNGAIEADSWYNKNCHTGVQAYNEGMAYLQRRAGDGIYLDLSIAPTFPYQYTHGRRISCDAWGTLGSTQYVMNNTSYGWWLNKVYFANDPDHLVMCLREDAGGIQTEGVNRARLTSGVVTGAYLTGDNFSPNVTLYRDNDKSKGTLKNYYETSQEKALKLLANDDVNEIPRTCQSFRPVYGNADTSGTQAENFMTYETDKYVYLAIISYKMLSPITGTMTWEDLGIAPADVESIKELWTGSDVTFNDGGFRYNCPYQDARIYRITKTDQGAGIHAVGYVPAAASNAIYDLSGRRVAQPQRGIYIKNGKKYVVK